MYLISLCIEHLELLIVDLRTEPSDTQMTFSF